MHLEYNQYWTNGDFGGIAIYVVKQIQCESINKFFVLKWGLVGESRLKKGKFEILF